MLHLPNTEIVALIVEDQTGIQELYRVFLENTGVTVVAVANNEQAFNFLDAVVSKRGRLYLIITDLGHENSPSERGSVELGGVRLIRHVRSRNDSDVVNGCFRLRHIPICVFSGQSTEALPLAREYRDLHVYDKSTLHRVLSTIGEALSSYRDRVLSDLQQLGLSIFWKGGRYHVAAAYSLPPRIEAQYFVAPDSAVGEFYSRIVLVTERSAVGQAAVDLFEALLNKPNTTEQEFQTFFQNHAEFLLSDQFDSYWAQKSLKSPHNSQIIRPDFVLQPHGGRENSWKWRVVDLKRPNVELFSSRRFHISLSSQVTKLITQLQDYADFFEDPRNHEMLMQSFGGVVPKPDLVGIIGRLPRDHREDYARLCRRVDGVTITTYDEVLELRRSRIEILRSMGL